MYCTVIVGYSDHLPNRWASNLPFFNAPTTYTVRNITWCFCDDHPHRRRVSCGGRHYFPTQRTLFDGRKDGHARTRFAVCDS